MPQLTNLGRGSGQYSNRGRLESARRKQITDALAKRGGVVIPNIGGRFQRTGLPDIFYLEDGVVFFFEIKRDGGDTTATQKRTLEKLSDAGAYVGVTHDAAETIPLIEDTLQNVSKQPRRHDDETIPTLGS